MDYNLWWTSEDKQGSIYGGMYSSEEKAMEAQEGLKLVLLAQCHDDAGRENILAGSWSLEPTESSEGGAPTWTEKPCLRYLVAEYEGNGFVMEDRGSGSTGPRWVEWDLEADLKYGHVQMSETNILVVPSTVRRIASVSFVSEWVEDEDLPGYEYRIYF